MAWCGSMRMARIQGDPEGESCYHVMSRTVSDEVTGMMFFGAREKNVFAKQMRKQAEFAGVEVLTWCMMDNHFHLLVRVPPREEFLEGLMSDGRKKFWKHMRVLYSRERVKAVREQVAKLEKKEKGNHDRGDQFLKPFTARMADLSKFVQGLKYAFSIWFNRKRGRKGTLWMGRFKSVLLEGEKSVLNKVAAYIDLNPIRAGLVKDPGDYRWSGYGQAVGGKVEARRGLSAVYGYARNEWKQISREYRQLLYLEGVEVRDSDGIVVRAGVSKDDFYRETAERGKEAAGKRMARRVRYFSDGAAIGSREFLERVFEKNRAMFGPKRKTGARKFRGPWWMGAGLFSLRDLGAR